MATFPPMPRRRRVEGLLAPGFIDVQVNGGGGVLFNDERTRQGIAAIGAAHRPFGTTGFLPTFITDTREHMREAIDAARDALAGRAFPACSAFTSRARSSAPSARACTIHACSATWTKTDIALVTSLGAGRTLMTLAPERVPPETIARLAAAGVIISAGHTAASYETVAAARAAGLTGFTHLFNAMPPLAGRAPGPVGAALDDPDAFVGIIADLFHVSAASLRIAIAAHGWQRMVLVTDAMPSVGSDLTEFLIDGNVITRRDGRLTRGDGTIAGSDLDMATAVRNCVNALGLPLEAACTWPRGRRPNTCGWATSSAASRRAIAPISSCSTTILQRHRDVDRWRGGRATREEEMARKRVLVVGLGNMGLSHALAYTRIDGFEVVGVCERNIAERTLPEALAGARRFTDYDEALATLKPDVVSICTWADTHADYAIQGDGGRRPCLRREAAGRDRRRCRARRRRRATRPAASSSSAISSATIRAGSKFIELARTLGTPLVFRMNLNQQSSGAAVGDPQAAAAVAVADRRLRRPLRRCLVPDHARRAAHRPCRRRPADRGHAEGHVQLRPLRGDLRRRFGRLVRGRLGPDDERDGLLREGRHRAQGLGVDRHGGRRRIGRHRHPHQDQPDPLSPGRTRRRRLARQSRTSASPPPTSPATTISASASSASS